MSILLPQISRFCNQKDEWLPVNAEIPSLLGKGYSITLDEASYEKFDIEEIVRGKNSYEWDGDELVKI